MGREGEQDEGSGGQGGWGHQWPGGHRWGCMAVLGGRVGEEDGIKVRIWLLVISLFCIHIMLLLILKYSNKSYINHLALNNLPRRHHAPNSKDGGEQCNKLKNVGLTLHQSEMQEIFINQDKMQSAIYFLSKNNC